MATLDAVRDAANRWLFPDMGEPWSGIRDVYVVGASSPTHYVDVRKRWSSAFASLRKHSAYVAGLGQEFDADQFLRNLAGSAGMVVGCEYAVTLQRLSCR